MNDIDKYIGQFDAKIQSSLQVLRTLFFEVYPECEESIRYNMLAFKLGTYYLYLASYKNHIGFYPVYGLSDLEDKISEYRGKGTKDSLHFTHSKPLPIDLIKRIIKLKSELT